MNETLQMLHLNAMKNDMYVYYIELLFIFIVLFSILIQSNFKMEKNDYDLIFKLAQPAFAKKKSEFV
jgi:hypothetical protein